MAARGCPLVALSPQPGMGCRHSSPPILSAAGLMQRRPARLGSRQEGDTALREKSHRETRPGSSRTSRKVFPIPLMSIWRRWHHGRLWFHWKGQALFPRQPSKAPAVARSNSEVYPHSPSRSPSPLALPRRRSALNLTAAAGLSAARSLA